MSDEQVLLMQLIFGVGVGVPVGFLIDWTISWVQKHNASVD